VVSPASHPYWTDYVSAFGAVVGIVVAGAAFVVALRSAKDASRSAGSAERTAQASASTLEAASEELALARHEHERLEADRARRPVVERIELSDVHARHGEESPAGVFRVGFSNTGDQDLRDAFFTILLDPGCVAVLVDRWGNVKPDQSKDETHERWPGVEGIPRAFDYFVRRISVPVGVASLQYVCIPRWGRFPIRVKLFHAALAGGGPWVDRWIDINDQGTATVVDLPDDGSCSGTAYDGRHADFDVASA
jgi:hypothetical protein